MQIHETIAKKGKKCYNFHSLYPAKNPGGEEKMKKRFSIILCISLVVSLVACGAKEPVKTEGGFAPALDTNTEGSIRVAGSYDNNDQS